MHIQKILHRGVLALAICALVAGTGAPAQAKSSLSEGTVFKGKGSSTLYYLNEDGRRLVFPNAETYFSWFDNFNNVVEVNDEDLADYQLGGNVRYRPGSLLVKIQTDPRVYAVGANGRLRWVKTEEIAKKLYGDDWNLLVDDIPTAFFVNYELDDPIETDSEFNPTEEELSALSISENRRAVIRERLAERLKEHQENVCDRLEKHVNRIQDRLERWGIDKPGIGDDFVSRCVSDNSDGEDGDEDSADRRGRIAICHIPAGSPEDAHTIIVGKPAARAHLAHGDTIGRCDGSGDDDTPADTTAPVISGVSATPSTTSATITWATNESSTSKVTYATESIAGASTTDEVSSAALVTSHSLDLTGLAPETLYYYMLTSTDASGNTATSSEMTFTTIAEPVVDATAPVISSIVATPSSTSATIAWTTDEPSTSRVEYANENLTTASSTNEVSSAALVTSHSLDLTGLATSTEYFFMIESTDAAANTATSAQDSFTTL